MPIFDVEKDRESDVGPDRLWAAVLNHWMLRKCSSFSNLCPQVGKLAAFQTRCPFYAKTGLCRSSCCLCFTIANRLCSKQLLPMLKIAKIAETFVKYSTYAAHRWSSLSPAFQCCSQETLKRHAQDIANTTQTRSNIRQVCSPCLPGAGQTADMRFRS